MSVCFAMFGIINISNTIISNTNNISIRVKAFNFLNFQSDSSY